MEMPIMVVAILMGAPLLLYEVGTSVIVAFEAAGSGYLELSMDQRKVRYFALVAALMETVFEGIPEALLQWRAFDEGVLTENTFILSASVAAIMLVKTLIVFWLSFNTFLLSGRHLAWAVSNRMVPSSFLCFSPSAVCFMIIYTIVD
jgi:hypothetical protein